MVHTRCMILGHDECQFETLPTTEEERDDFRENRDWGHVDKLIDDYLNKRLG